MSKAKRSQIQGMIENMIRGVHGKIPGWCIQSGWSDRKGHVFLLRMPITDAWEELPVPAQHLANCCIPREVQDKLDYWVYMRKLVDHMRDYQTLSGDLRPITPEEKAIFGSRTMDPNPCFPQKTKYPRGPRYA